MDGPRRRLAIATLRMVRARTRAEVTSKAFRRAPASRFCSFGNQPPTAATARLQIPRPQEPERSLSPTSCDGFPSKSAYTSRQKSAPLASTTRLRLPHTAMTSSSWLGRSRSGARLFPKRPRLAIRRIRPVRLHGPLAFLLGRPPAQSLGRMPKRQRDHGDATVGIHLRVQMLADRVDRSGSRPGRAPASGQRWAMEYVTNPVVIRAAVACDGS